MLWNRMKYLAAPEGDPPGGTTTAATTPTPQAGGQPGAVTTPAPQTGDQVTTKAGKVLPMAQISIDRLKKENQEKGRRAFEKELETKAKAFGYDSVEDMMKAAEQAKKGGATAQPPKPATPARPNGNANGKGGKKNGQPDPQQTRRAERREREIQARLDRERRDKLKFARKAEDAERRAWAAEADGELRVMAIQEGVKDPDYAITLLTREMNEKRSAMDDETYKKYVDEFKEAEFFRGLKKTRPHLFTETVVPATTGTDNGSGGAPPPPGTGKVTQAAATAAQVDVRKMSKQEYDQHIRSKGLTPPSL